MPTLYHHKHGGASLDHKSTVLDFSVNISPLMPPIGNLSLNDFALQAYPSIDGKGINDFYTSRFGLERSMVLPLNGAVEGIYLLPRALGLRHVVTLSPSFYEYERASLIAGATIATVPLVSSNRFQLPSIERLAEELQEADAFIVGNPNNPTGTEVAPEIIMALASRFPFTWFIVDEAFLQFTPAFPDNSLMQKVKALQNVIVVHSLTKFYTLPGLRLGALIAHPDVIERLLYYKEPWTVNTIAESVARRLADCGDYEEELRVMIASERERITSLFAGSGDIRLAGGAANFFLAQWVGGCSLDVLMAQLAQRNISIRDCRNFAGLEENYFRFALRTPAENDRLLAELLPATCASEATLRTQPFQRNFTHPPFH